MSGLVGIECDTCLRTRVGAAGGHPSIGRERRAAREAGWHTTSGTYESAGGYTRTYTRDICAVCWAEGKR